MIISVKRLAQCLPHSTVLGIVTVITIEMKAGENWECGFPIMTCAVWLWKMSSETPLCPWRIERSGLTGEGTKDIEIVFFLKKKLWFKYVAHGGVWLDGNHPLLPFRLVPASPCPLLLSTSRCLDLV